jgi:primosomal protein N' (replication factor Y)
MKDTCPECGSRYIGGMKAGTEQIEMQVNKAFPQAKTLRMDMDTTRNKGDYEKILSAFANEEADILIGTQMIVKGHDFPKVTLMGILAADMSLFAGDYRSSERTFELLTQAAGRAGRAISGSGERRLMGEVVIQTYSPENYAIVTAAHQDYHSFYEEEIAFRSMGDYPPEGHMLQILIEDKDEARAKATADGIAQSAGTYGASSEKEPRLLVIGPTDASISKINDVYRKVVYIKSGDYERLASIKDAIEADRADRGDFGSRVEFDFDP